MSETEVEKMRDATFLKWTGVAGSFVLLVVVAALFGWVAAAFAFLGMMLVLIGCVGADREADYRAGYDRRADR